MKDKKTTVYAGVGFFELLGVVFITLKLIGIIDWSWWFVLMPIYGPIVIWFLGFIIVLTIVVIKELISKHRAQKDRAKIDR